MAKICAPAAAVAVVGSPSTPDGLTAPTPAAQGRQERVERLTVAGHPPVTPDEVRGKQKQQRGFGVSGVRVATRSPPAAPHHVTILRAQHRDGAQSVHIAAVAADEHHPDAHSHRTPELDQNRRQGGGADRDRARELLMLAGGAIATAGASRYPSSSAIPRATAVAMGVGVQRQVRSVLFEGTDRHGHRRGAVHIARSQGPEFRRCRHPPMVLEKSAAAMLNGWTTPRPRRARLPGAPVA